MYAVLKWLHLLALIVWLGAVVFLSFVVAPSLFRTLARADAGRVVSVLFPVYYRLGYACGIVLLATSLLFWRRGRALWGLGSILTLVMLLATLYAGARVLPRAAVLRPQLDRPQPAPAVAVEFDRLHRTAVALNGVVFLCGVALSAVAAAALRP